MHLDEFIVLRGAREPKIAMHPMVTQAQQTVLWGWGAQRRVACDERFVENVEEARRLLDASGTVGRGLGRSYGDAALNEGRRVLTTTRLDRYLAFDEATGTLTCEAGVSLEHIVRDFAPRGFFPAITPGTKFVTIGGCIANDVHGKAHHAQGTFVTCVKSLTLLVADGTLVTCSRTQHPELFWATFGGMGLTGLITEATITLRRIETSYFRQRSIVARDLAEMLAVLQENDGIFPYSVASLDCIATGRRLGRGVLTVGDHARLEELPATLSLKPLAMGADSPLQVPFELPELTLNPLTIRLVNQVIQGVLRAGRPFAHYDSFFYPLDVIGEWNRGYGRRGFIQYQFVVPFADGEKILRDLLTTIMSSGQLPFLNILKRMGAANEAPLSFPQAGYTFAIDFPIRDGLVDLTRRLDAMVADVGGRIYLGKDSFLEAAMFRRMYLRLPEWLAVKHRWDPKALFSSDLGRRLELV
jgi:decaprenylphospho-beta-D-ribofuranose 2-oxidase